MKKKKRPLGERGEEYDALLNRLAAVKTAKEVRELHKEFKKYGDGLCFLDRYPYFPIWVSGFAFVVSIVTMVLRMLGVGN